MEKTCDSDSTYGPISAGLFDVRSTSLHPEAATLLPRYEPFIIVPLLLKITDNKADILTQTFTLGSSAQENGIWHPMGY
ncbi:hypothetical protein DPEC_G00004500 [Dallia pectoralis]|uniref:Uncharacterized protein n=1 Tax=Dallia pectoralis TaxID=75939 RepID=A0ACC2HL30_DALPE|nr:hypothetical protein DPEC_G00004500 [Dallia pectoralis]